MKRCIIRSLICLQTLKKDVNAEVSESLTLETVQI